MSMVTAVDVVLQFVDRINARDIDGIVALMTDDHRFTDSLGAQTVGCEKMRHGWEEYFRMVPDYRIEVRETLSDGPVVVLLGLARGTWTRDGTLDPENAWQTPAAWRAVVRDERVAEWQVYADNEPIRRILREYSA
jgi:ketosteroid isomerase-like protein